MTAPPFKAQITDGFSKSFIVIVFFLVVLFVIFFFKFVPADRYVTFVGIGQSMYPTFNDGDEIVVDAKATPLQGDVIVFDCTECYDLPNDETLAKRIYQTNSNECYWLIGDNKDTSYDSRSTGWLCPSQHIKIHGVVVKLNGENY